jgi:hypothetical protein
MTPIIYLHGDYGGYVFQYVEHVLAARQSGAQIVIDGPCASACTLYLGLPENQVCAAPHAALGFHAGSGAEATAKLWAAYPPRIREWIMAHGGLTDVVRWLTGPELFKRMRVCP